MDQIKFEITQLKQYEKSSIMQYDVNVIINGKKLPHNFFNAAEVLAVAAFDKANFDLFTCGCGAPGCAGFQIPVSQNKNDTVVIWKFPDDNSYKVDKEEYEFNRISFESELKKLRSKMVGLETAKTYHCSTLRDMEDYIGEGEEYTERFEVRDSLAKSIKWYEKNLKLEEEFNVLLNEKFPSLVNSHFHFEYEGDSQRSESFDFSYFVCRMINQWPSNNGGKGFLRKVVSAGKAIEEAVEKQNYKKFINIVHKVYLEFSTDESNKSEGVFHGFDSEIRQIAVPEGFDINKLKIVMD